MFKLIYIYNRPALKRLLRPTKSSDPSQSDRSLKAIKKSRFVILLIGKFRRFYLVHFRKKHVQEQLAIRKGECRQCAQCCVLLFACPMKTQENRCLIYGESRWEVCKVFPIDKKDILEVVLCGGTCGYSFEENLLRKRTIKGVKTDVSLFHGRSGLYCWLAGIFCVLLFLVDSFLS